MTNCNNCIYFKETNNKKNISCFCEKCYKKDKNIE